MNRPVWSSPASLSGCALIEPLLPLYADGLASPAELRLVDAHLPDCAGCRETLTWIQATHAALAARPIAVPPPDLHGRIAQAIAAASAAPVRLRPARVFSLRPAYAAAASLAALGIAFGLSHSLRQPPVQVAVKRAVRPKVYKVATLPPPAVTKTHALPKPRHAVAASNPVKPLATVKHQQIARKPAPAVETPQKQVASNRVPETPPVTKTLTIKTPVHRLPPSKLIAANTPKKLEHTRTLPMPKHVTLKTPNPQFIANVPKQPAHIAVDIQPPTVHVDPPVKVASREPPTPKLDNGLGTVNAFAAKLRNASYSTSGFTARDASRGAANIMHMADSNSVRTFADIHPPSGQ